MSLKSNPQPSTFTGRQAASDQAAEWLVRLRAHDVTAQEEAEFAEWLAASSQHKQAFDELLSIWELTADLPNRAAPQTRSWRRRWIPLAAAASVLIACTVWFNTLQHELIRTAKGEQLRVVLDDGSVAYLNTNSAIEIDYGDDARLVSLLSGEVLFEVVKDPQRPFRVDAEFASATAVGTAFVVRDTGGYTKISVTEGLVSVENSATYETNAKPVLLKAGDQSTASSAVFEIQPFDPNLELSWREGQLVYDNVPLGQLLQDLNRYLPKTMTLSDDRLAQLKVSAVFRIGDQQAMLEALSRTLPIRWKILSDSLIIISPAAT